MSAQGKLIHVQKAQILNEPSEFFENSIWLNTGEAAVFLRTTPKQIRKWSYQGKIKAYRLLGRSLRFKRNELASLFIGGSK